MLQLIRALLKGVRRKLSLQEIVVRIFILILHSLIVLVSDLSFKQASVRKEDALAHPVVFLAL